MHAAFRLVPRWGPPVNPSGRRVLSVGSNESKLNRDTCIHSRCTVHAHSQPGRGSLGPTWSRGILVCSEHTEQCDRAPSTAHSLQLSRRVTVTYDPMSDMHATRTPQLTAGPPQTRSRVMPSGGALLYDINTSGMRRFPPMQLQSDARALDVEQTCRIRRTHACEKRRRAGRWV